MTREEKARELARTINANELTQLRAFEALVEMGKWCDEHPTNRWISVKDRLPKKIRELELLEDEHDKVVIVRRRFGEVVTAYLDAEEIWRLYPTGRPFYGDITHWMPIPELLKGGAE